LYAIVGDKLILTFYNPYGGPAGLTLQGTIADSKLSLALDVDYSDYTLDFVKK
jgi:hypothetical protein